MQLLEHVHVSWFSRPANSEALARVWFWDLVLALISKRMVDEPTSTLPYGSEPERR